MPITGQLTLRDRVFRVVKAEVQRQGDAWTVEIETDTEAFDGENWAPRLYHQGLRLPALTGADLQGLTTAWASSQGTEYPHPELGVMYVFGHHPIAQCALSFGEYKNGGIELRWEGLCDVFWDAAFHAGVPFSCVCSAVVRGG
jgi:hypothetical protein